MYIYYGLILEEIASFYNILYLKMKNNIVLDSQILWYNINKDGCIQGSLKNKPAVYIYMYTSREKYSYVGSSALLINRTNAHKYRINNWSKDYYNNNGALTFYNLVLKHGWNNFKFGVLEYVDLLKHVDLFKIKNSIDKKKIILHREQYYLNIINPSLNLCKVAGSPLGIKHNIVFSKNLSQARKGKKNNIKLNTFITRYIMAETRLKLSYRSSGIKVKLFDKLNNLIREFPTMKSTAEFLGVSDRTIRRILNTGISYDDYIYKFEIKTENLITVVNKENNTTKSYHSIRAIAKDIKVSTLSISKHINTDKL